MAVNDGPFSSYLSAWGAPLSEFTQVALIPKKFAALAFKRRLLSETLQNNRDVSKGDLRKEFGALSFAAIGVGAIVATGIFSFMPYIYTYIAGPAVILSLLMAALTAALSAYCYSEFAVEYPIVGGGFAYTMMVFGEFPALLCGVNLVIDYIFGTAAVIRNFSVYFAQLINKDSDIFQVSAGGNELDYMALGMCLFLTVVVALSSRVFNEGNMAMQVLHIGLVVFTFIAAFTKAETSNLTPFFPTEFGNGGRAVVTGAANIFFVMIGYDVIALGAEEAKTDMSVPIGMLGAVIFTTILYVLMSLSLVMLIPWQVLALQPTGVSLSGFAYAFTYRGMEWAKYIVSLGACVGIITSTGAGIFGLSRIWTVFSRERIIPPFLGWVSTRTETPVIAVIISGLASAIISFITGFSSLANMTSIGTLIMYWFVACALIYRRYAPGMVTEEASGGRHLSIPYRMELGLSEAGQTALLVTLMFLQTAAPVGFTIYWNLSGGYAWLIPMCIIWFISTLGIQIFCPIHFVPAKFHVPWYLLPWLPAASIWLNIMLVGGFGATGKDYVRLAVALAIGIAIYFLYSIHASYYRFYGPKATEKMYDPSHGKPQVEAMEGKVAEV